MDVSNNTYYFCIYLGWILAKLILSYIQLCILRNLYYYYYYYY